ncbi:hypothetical protein DXG01_008656, partial [Tephrocybe rancida]
MDSVPIFVHHLSTFLLDYSQEFYEAYTTRTHIAYRDTWLARLIMFTHEDNDEIGPILQLLSNNLDTYWTLLWPDLFAKIEQTRNAALAVTHVFDEFMAVDLEDAAAPLPLFNVFAAQDWAYGTAQHVHTIFCSGSENQVLAVNPSGPKHQPPPTAQLPDVEQLLFISKIMRRADFHEADSIMNTYLRSFHENQPSAPAWRRPMTAGPPSNDTS